MTKQQVLRILKAEKAKLQNDFNIERIGLFGSFSKKTNQAASDVDLLYTMKEGRYLKFDDKLNLQKYLKSKLKRRVDLVSAKYMNPAIQVKIQSELIYV